MIELRVLLKKCSNSEIKSLSQILNSDSNIDSVIYFINMYGNNLFSYDQSSDYKLLLFKVCKKLNIQNYEKLKIPEIETEIVKEILKSSIANMNKDEIEKFENDLNIVSNKNGYGNFVLKSGGIAAILATANLSGFGVYLLATYSTAAISGLIGVTLPFVVYTTLTTTISIVTGPIGWIGLGIYTLHNFTKLNFSKLIPAILFIISIKAKYLEGYYENGGSVDFDKEIANEKRNNPDIEQGRLPRVTLKRLNDGKNR